MLQEIALALSGELDRTRLYEGIVQGARRLLGVPLSAVLAWDPGREQLVTEAAIGEVPRLAVAAAELPALEGRAFLDRRTTTLDDYSGHPRAPEFARAMRVQAAVAVPLLREGEALGVLFAAHTVRGRRFDAEDLRLLELLVSHVALALANAETVATATRRLARAEELANALRGVAEARERDAIAQRALDCATTVLGADRAALYLIDLSSGDVSFVAGRRLSRRYLEDVANHYRRSVGGLLPLTRAPLFVADLATDPRTRVLHETAQREGVHSSLIVPLLHRDQVFGALALYHDLIWSYDAEELAQVRALADQVALALGSAAAHQQTWRQLAQLRALDGLVRAVSDPVSEAERCQRGCQALVAGGGATRAWVWQAGGSALAILARAGSTTLLDSTARDAARACLAAGRAMVHTEGGGDPLIAAPIEHQGNIYGALVLSLPRPAPAEQRPATIFIKFAEELEPEARHEFASTAAGQIATAIANARLYEEARSTGSRLAAVISGMPEGILVFDRDDRLVFYNPTALEVYGLENVDLTGWTPADFVREVSHCFADPRVPHEIARLVKERRDAVHRIEFELKHPRRRFIERISAPVISSDGQSFGQVILYHDQTERRDAERSKDHFFALAGHELRAPLEAARELAIATRGGLAREGHAGAAAQIDRVDELLGRLAALIAELSGPGGGRIIGRP